MHPRAAAALRNEGEDGPATTPPPKAVGAATAPSLDRAIAAARTAAGNRARDVVVLDMTPLVQWTDYLVVATAASRRQLRSVADAVEKALEELGDVKLGVEGYELGEWIVVDFADVVVHVFSPEKRAYYEIENLWGDAPRVSWEPPAAAE
jgi:ribosome-associated protein